MAETERLTSDKGFSADLKRSFAARRGLSVALVLLVLLAVGVNLAWQSSKPALREAAQYRVTASTIQLTPQPEWIKADVKYEALNRAGLLDGATGESLSMLDSADRLEERLATALRFHPWVLNVGQQVRQAPNRLSIEVEYRRPLAAVQTESGLAPIDPEMRVLPAEDLSPADLGYLPRIEGRPLLSSGAESPPPAGETWQAPAIEGALRIISSFGPAWRELKLLDVAPSRSPVVRGNVKHHVYELRTVGNTQIAWGAAPGVAPPDEQPFEAKLRRLTSYVAENGPLDRMSGTPARIDVRTELKTEPRLVKKDANQTAKAPTDEVVK